MNINTDSHAGFHGITFNLFQVSSPLNSCLASLDIFLFISPCTFSSQSPVPTSIVPISLIPFVSHLPSANIHQSSYSSCPSHLCRFLFSRSYVSINFFNSFFPSFLNPCVRIKILIENQHIGTDLLLEKVTVIVRRGLKSTHSILSFHTMISLY